MVARRAEIQLIRAFRIGTGARARPRARVPVVAPAGLGSFDVAGGLYGRGLRFEDRVCRPCHDNDIIPESCARGVDGTRTQGRFFNAPSANE